MTMPANPVAERIGRCSDSCDASQYMYWRFVAKTLCINLGDNKTSPICKDVLPYCDLTIPPVVLSECSAQWDVVVRIHSLECGGSGSACTVVRDLSSKSALAVDLPQGRQRLQLNECGGSGSARTVVRDFSSTECGGSGSPRTVVRDYSPIVRSPWISPHCRPRLLFN